MKEYYGSIIFKKIDAKMLYKILPYQIKQYQNQVEFILGMQGWLSIQKSIII